VSAFRPRGVPGPTNKLSLRVPAQMSRRETGHKGGRTVRGNHGLHVVLRLGRMDALALGGYKRSRGREREPYASARSPARPIFCTRALDLPFIDVRRGPRCTMGGCSNVLTCLGERSWCPMYMPSWLSERCCCPVHVMSWPSDESWSPAEVQLSGLSDPC
jgi:hypothetical protein